MRYEKQDAACDTVIMSQIQIHDIKIPLCDQPSVFIFEVVQTQIRIITGAKTNMQSHFSQGSEKSFTINTDGNRHNMKTVQRCLNTVSQVWQSQLLGWANITFYTTYNSYFWMLKQ